jgi:sRNA-binding carbon storage regulator CsrA
MKIHRAEVVEAVKESNTGANVSGDSAEAAGNALKSLVGKLHAEQPEAANNPTAVE